jgi:hypothetical protein
MFLDSKRCLLLPDVLLDDLDGSAAAGCGEIAGRPQSVPPVKSSEVRVGLLQDAGRNAFKAVD